jgi:hypothetical protein
MKLKSFGCSFTYGSDLADCADHQHSCLTWPALIAQKLDLSYECHAWPGIGNLQIMQKVLEQISDTQASVFVINWTWLDRFDYLHPVHESFLTLRPDGDLEEHRLYYKYFYNQYHTVLTNAAWIVSVIAMLQARNIKFVMTCMDPILMETINPNWQDPRSVTLLQNQIGPHLSWFDSKSFLEWSRSKGYPESESWHPLESAHHAAADYMITVFDKQKISDPVQQARV